MAETPAIGIRVPPELRARTYAAASEAGWPDATLTLMVRSGLALLADSPASVISEYLDQQDRAIAATRRASAVRGAA